MNHKTTIFLGATGLTGRLLLKRLVADDGYGIPFKAAKLAKEKDISTFMVMSSNGANARNRIFYSRTKGMME